ncbi:hypothetical protein [Streptomyces sp. 13-12-16]|uniref:hypothetical protein n=1 Tax=Streptomyces sp. 13-12-16 TaxID=1570823 RepID=UPI00358FE46F
MFDAPLAQARMIRHRRAHACGVERRRNPEPLPETARLLSSALIGEQSGKPPDAAVSDAGFSVGLELILDGIATRIGHATA